MILEELDKYYRSKGIHAENFTCPFKEECKNSENFTGPKSSGIPKEYENTIPRIVFLSLDPGCSDKEIEKRTPEGVRELNQTVPLGPKNKHWYQTHLWAKEILNKIGGFKFEKEEQTRGYFAHVNSAKCCQNYKYSRMANDILFKNCRTFLKEELKIINPQIIVTQGRNAEYSLNCIISKERNCDEYIKLIKDEYIKLIKIDNLEILCINTYHPSAFGYYFKQKDKYMVEINIIEKLNSHFIKVFESSH